MIMKIVKAQLQDATSLAEIIREANKPVASQFNLTMENNPKHPSFYTEKWVHDDFERGEEYFICVKNNKPVACVAYESPNEDKAYLNRLAVLPAYQHQGIGEKLVEHHFDYARLNGKQQVSIGIIAEHESLKLWYVKLGFTEVGLKEFTHLPFNVLFMTHNLR